MAKLGAFMSLSSWAHAWFANQKPKKKAQQPNDQLAQFVMFQHYYFHNI